MEFFRSGQENFVDPVDPRFSVAFVDTGECTPERDCYVKESSFHHGYSPAIGLFDANGMLVSDNVIYFTVGSGKSLIKERLYTYNSNIDM